MTFRRVLNTPAMFEALSPGDGRVFAVTTATGGTVAVAFRRSTPLVPWNEVGELAHFMDSVQRELDGQAPRLLLASAVEVRRTDAGGYVISTTAPPARSPPPAARLRRRPRPPYPSSSSA